jgi:hypothetical protein
MTVVRVAASADTAWALGTTAAGLALARYHKGAWSEAIAPPIGVGDEVVVLVADRGGALLAATRGGGVFLGAADGTWTPGHRTDALPTGPTGPGPARAR